MGCFVNGNSAVAELRVPSAIGRRISTCLRGWVEVVFAVPFDRMPGNDLIRAVSGHDASVERGLDWAATSLFRLQRRWCGGMARSSSTWRRE